MEHRAFGNTGLTVPTIGMGTWQTFDVRGSTAETHCRSIVDAAIAAGTTLFDTSPMYGNSPRVLAKALEGRSDSVLVADKIWTRSLETGREQIQRTLALFDGRLEIYQIHNLVSWREHLPVLEELRAKGTIRVIGATHYDHAAFPELIEVMQTGRIAMVQIPYNAADRVVEQQVLPLAHSLGLGVLIMRPLGAGALVRQSPSAGELARLEPYGVTTWAQALLKWILSDPRVHCAIPATSRIERAKENAAAGDPPWFDEDTRAYVARLARG
jgi:aryl-alcohol dehydrogenase-like predicted oxidoreductase